MPTTGNIVFATPRALIAFLENNVNEDGTVRIPKALQLGGKDLIFSKK